MAEDLAVLKPAFTQDRMMHVGSASQIPGGAAAVLVTTPEKASELGLTPRSGARRVPWAWLAEADGCSQRFNPLSGAIVSGRLLGSSAAVLMARVIHHMRDNGVRYELPTTCHGDIAGATLVELMG